MKKINIITGLSVDRGAARIFLGGVEVMKAKCLEKGKIACEYNSQGKHIICGKQLTVVTTKSRGPSN